MKKIKGILSYLLCAIVFICQLTACWNYKEIEKTSIVAGVAIDQDQATGRYVITAEVIEIMLGSKETQIGTKILLSEGETLFDAARNFISVSGEKLYWSHAKVLIISKEIANKGIIPALDFVHRDAEPRYDLDLIVSQEKASSIFQECHNNQSGIISYMITEVLISEESLSKAPRADEWQFINDLQDDDFAAIVPMISVIDNGGKKIPQVMGTGIFKKDKMIGYLDGEETETLLFILDRIKGGLLIIEDIYKHSEGKATLEIFNNKTKIKPQVTDDQIIMDIHVQTEVALAENTGSMNFNEEENLKKLKAEAEKELEEKIQGIIKKVQSEFGTDIFQFAKIVRINLPNEWDQVKEQWEQVFVNVDAHITVEVNIRNTGFSSKPIKVGE